MLKHRSHQPNSGFTLKVWEHFIPTKIIALNVNEINKHNQVH